MRRKLSALVLCAALVLTLRPAAAKTTRRAPPPADERPGLASGKSYAEIYADSWRCTARCDE
jgi:hypothetical protein